DRQGGRGAQAVGDGRGHRHPDPCPGGLPVQLGARFVTRVAVLGTGVVGRTLSARFAEVGHDVLSGSRTAKDDRVRSFAEAAGHGDLVVHATHGLSSIAALTAAGAENLAGKPLLDVSNALDASSGFPPRVVASEAESNAERIQAAFPGALVVKGLNTMN